MDFSEFVMNKNNYSLSKLANAFGQATDPETSLDG